MFNLNISLFFFLQSGSSRLATINVKLLLETFENLTGYLDWRYTHLRDSNIGWMSHGFGLVTYWVVFSGLGFHIYPTLSVFGGLLPGIYAIEDSEAQKLNVLDIVGNG